MNRILDQESETHNFNFSNLVVFYIDLFNESFRLLFNTCVVINIIER